MWVVINSTGKIFGVQSPPTPKINWYFGLIIKSYYQEQTP